MHLSVSFEKKARLCMWYEFGLNYGFSICLFVFGDRLCKERSCVKAKFRVRKKDRRKKIYRKGYHSSF